MEARLSKVHLNTAIAAAPVKPVPVQKVFIDELSKCILRTVEWFYNKADGVEFPIRQPEWDSMFLAPESHVETVVVENEHDPEGEPKSQVEDCTNKTFTTKDLTEDYEELFAGMDELGFTYKLNKQRPSVTILWNEKADNVQCYPVPY